MSANTIIDINVGRIATNISGLGLAIIILLLFYYSIIISLLYFLMGFVINRTTIHCNGIKLR